MHPHKLTTFERKPVIPTLHSPADAIGHDYNKFCDLYAKYYRAREAARGDNRNFVAKWKDETDEMIFGSSLRKLEAHGYVITGLNHKGRPIFKVRIESASDDMFNDNNTYGGVPPIDQLEEMGSAKCREMFKKVMRGIG